MARSGHHRWRTLGSLLMRTHSGLHVLCGLIFHLLLLTRLAGF